MEQMPDKFPGDNDLKSVSDLSDNYLNLNRMTLYKIWLELNGYPKKPGYESRHNLWRTARHKFAVAADISIYLVLLPLILTLSTSANTTPLFLILVALLTYIISRRLPNEYPFGVVGVLSFISNHLGNHEVETGLAPPPIHEVNLYSIDVIERAATKMIEPSIKKIQQSIVSLDVQMVSINKERGPLISLKQKIAIEMSKSDANWQHILAPKLSKVNALIEEDDAQLENIARLKQHLNDKLLFLEKELNQLRNRKEIMSQLAKIEDETTQTSSFDHAFQNTLNSLFDTVNETEEGLSEAQNLATAHEQAKAEIAQLLEH